MDKGTNAFKSKLYSWLKLYAIAELFGTFGAYSGYFLGNEVTGSVIVSAYAGALGENMGYYSTIIYREFKTLKAAPNGSKSTISLIPKVIFKTILEFGPAEIFDSTLSRPFFMGVASHYFGPVVGVVIGKITADLIFYIPVIISAELLNKNSNEKHNQNFIEFN